ncbi:MAG: Ldh family oxidoreductase [Chloroflexota bacterium]
MNESPHYVNWLLLKDFGTQALTRVGIPEKDAGIIANTLVEAELRGVDTHGLVQLAPFVRMVTEGKVNPRPKLSIVKETPVSAVLDGDDGIGNLVCVRAAELAIKKAQETGVGLAGTRNSTHCGALAYYPMLALKQYLMGFMTVNGPPLIPAYGGITRLLSTNPYSAAIPAGEERPVVLDMAVTVATRGKMRLKARLGEKIPPGWALDRYGQPTDDPKEALDYGFQAWMGEHKGYALAVLSNILSGVLTGCAFSPRTYPPYDMAAEFGSQLIRQGQFILVLCIESVRPLA